MRLRTIRFWRRLRSSKHADGVDSRKMLTAYVSDDDGRTWPSGLLLDERAISYSHGQQDANGIIHIIYDRSRTGAREITMATLHRNCEK